MQIEPHRLSEKARSAIQWVFLTQVSTFALGFVTSVILARLLQPRDFGIVGMGTMFLEVSYVVGNFGMAGALIQRRDLDDLHADVAFVTSSLAGATLAVIFCVIASPVARFFGNDLVAPIMRILSLSVLLSGVSATAVALMQRSLNFGKTGILSVSNAFVNGAVAITLAGLGFGVWSLVWGGVVASMITVVVSHSMAGYVPRLRFDRAAFSSLAGFGGGLTIKNIFVYLSRNLDYFVVGKRLGETPLGLYTRAFNLMSIPQRQILSQVNQVAFPAFSRIQDDQQRIREWYLRSTRLVALMAVPAFLALLVVADDFVITCYTEKWAAMTSALWILCIAGIFRILFSLGTPVMEASGRIFYEVYLGFANAVLILVGALAGSFWGIEGVAVGVTVASIVVYAARAALLRVTIGLPLVDYLRIPLVPALYAVGSGAVALALKSIMSRGWGHPYVLCLNLGVFFITYLGFMLAFSRGECLALLSELRRVSERALGFLRIASRSGAPRTAVKDSREGAPGFAPSPRVVSDSNGQIARAPTEAVEAYERAVAELERAGVRHCLLRDFPRRGFVLKDLDLVIHPEDFAPATRALFGVGFIFDVCARPTRFKVSLLAPCENGAARLDIHLRPVQEGLVFFDVETLLSRVVLSNGYYVPCPEDRFALLLVHNILGKGELQPKHLPVLETLHGSGLDRRKIEAALAPYGIAVTVLEIADHLREYAADQGRCMRARRVLLMRLILANWRGWPRLVGLALARQLERVSLRRRGTLIALMGPDGSGKTLLAHELSKRLSDIFRQHVPVRYMGPWSHHELSLARRVCQSPDDDRSWSHFKRELYLASRARPLQAKVPLGVRVRVLWKLLRGTPHDRLDRSEDKARRGMSETSLFYTVAKYAYHHARNTVDALILSIELAWRYLRIYNVLRRGGHVIADRYVYDLLSGSTRNVTGKRRSFATVFCRLFPRPDVFYLLWNDPREIARRKSDLDESRARLMLAFYESAARRFGARVLKTDRPVDELARLIVREDLSRMIAKMAPRRLRVYTNTLL